MTYDELLDILGHWNWIEPEPLLNALRVVVELHKPDYESDTCSAESCRAAYLPCPTIQAIEKELR